MSLAAGTRLGHYEVLARIGAGGMGEVYRARETPSSTAMWQSDPMALADDPERMDES